MSLPSFQPTRREFIKAGLATVALPPLAISATAGGQPTSFWFIQYGTGPHKIGTGRCWPVDDPAAWALANADNPLLARARERLKNAQSCSDPQRVIRLVTRRCKLNLIAVSPQQVVVHFWGEDGGPPWLQPFFKRHCLARCDVQVLLLDRKRETVTEERGDDHLFGQELPEDFPLDMYLQKWEQRDQLESDDWTPVPGSHAGYCWNGLERDNIPWVALKSSWRRTAPGKCANCERPTILTNFGAPWGMLGPRHRLDYLCRHCERLLKDYSVADAGQWMLANLDAECLPSHVMTGHYGAARWPITNSRSG